MRMTDIATATAAVWWYHLPPEGQYTDANAPLYDAIATVGGRHSYAQTVVETMGDVNGQVLEIGAGTGLVSKTLAAHHGDRLLCSDIERSALALNPHSAKFVADCCNLPLADKSVEAVVGIGVYRYIRHHALGTFWSEMHRVIRQGGRLVLGEFHPRFFGIRGAKVADNQADHLFALESGGTDTTHMRLGNMAVRIGEYRTYSFRSR